jgi:hypothetical protein
MLKWINNGVLARAIKADPNSRLSGGTDWADEQAKL